MSMQGRGVGADKYVSPKDLRAQDTYLMVSFFDEALLIPEITTVVYLGKDIFSEGDQKHYFQNYEFFINKTKAGSDVAVIEAAEDKLMNFYDLDSAASLLEECAQRRSQSRSK